MTLTRLKKVIDGTTKEEKMVPETKTISFDDFINKFSMPLFRMIDTEFGVGGSVISGGGISITLTK